MVQIRYIFTEFTEFIEFIEFIDTKRIFTDIYHFFYRIDQLLFIVWRLIRGKPPLPTERFDKLSVFWSINYRFQINSILSQDLESQGSKIECVFVLSTKDYCNLHDEMLGCCKEIYRVSVRCAEIGSNEFNI